MKADKEVSNMVVFSSVARAVQAGFRWVEFSTEYGLHVMEIVRQTQKGRVRALAFARADRHNPDAGTQNDSLNPYR